MLKYPVVNLPEVAISSLNHVIRVGGVGFHLYNVSCVALIISLSSKNTHLPLPAYFFDATFPLFALIRGLTYYAAFDAFDFYFGVRFRGTITQRLTVTFS